MKSAAKRATSESGVTILELIIGTSIMGVLLAVASPNFATLQTSYQLTSATRETAQFVRLSRAIAVGRNRPSRIVVSENGSTMTMQVFSDGAWAAVGTPVVFDGGTAVSAIQPSASALAFSAQGTAAGAVTITLRTSRGDQRNLVVGLLGSVNPA